MATHGRTRDRVIDALKAVRPFKTSGSLRGVEGREGFGRLPQQHIDQFQRDSVVYTVYSCATPIAWVTKSGLVRVPNVRYSVTTSPQQTMCRVYLAGEGER
jgi:hypothetical protein